MDRPDLCFLTVPLRPFWPDYQFTLSAEDRETLGLDQSAAAAESDLLLLAILSLEQGRDPTANLLAPLAIHPVTHRAVQAVRQDGRYALREPLPAGEVPCS